MIWLFRYVKSFRGSCCSLMRNQSDGEDAVIITNVGVTGTVPLFESICWENVDTQRSFGGRVTRLLFYDLKSFGRLLERTVAFPLSQNICYGYSLIRKKSGRVSLSLFYYQRSFCGKCVAVTVLLSEIILRGGVLAVTVLLSESLLRKGVVVAVLLSETIRCGCTTIRENSVGRCRCDCSIIRNHSAVKCRCGCSVIRKLSVGGCRFSCSVIRNLSA